MFAGGATGTAVAGALFAAYGWSGAIGGGFGFLGLAVVVLALHTRRTRGGSVVADDADSAMDAGTSGGPSLPGPDLAAVHRHAACGPSRVKFGKTLGR
nr:hypothetical protein OH826_15030 [Streptomyces sp. NBC_00899]